MFVFQITHLRNLRIRSIARIHETREPTDHPYNFRMVILLSVAIGGALGAVLRYSSGQLLSETLNSMGITTFLVNTMGSLGLGLFFGYVESRTNIPKTITAGMAVGLFGGFTTFSTYMLDIVLQAEAEKIAWAIILVSATIVIGLLAILLGLSVGRQL